MIGVNKWGVGKWYNAGDVVIYCGVLYVCQVGNQDIIPIPVLNSSDTLNSDVGIVTQIATMLYGSASGHLNYSSQYWTRQ